MLSVYFRVCSGLIPDSDLCGALACSLALAQGEACVDADLTPPELDRDSIDASMTPSEEDSPDGSGNVNVKFLARDDKAGIGTVSYRYVCLCHICLLTCG